MNLDMLGWAASNSLEFEREFARLGYRPGRVTRKEKHLYHVRVEDGGDSIMAVSGGFRHAARGAADYPVVGDWVAFEPATEAGRATIHAVLQRRTVFSRQAVAAAGKERKVEEQVLASNIDVVLIVAALDGGRGFNLRRIERYLTLAWNSGARPVVVLNKADLADDVEGALEQARSAAANCPVHAVSALHDAGMGALRAHIGRGVTLVLLGPSGVGKSSLVNRLAGGEIMRVGGIRGLDARGRHTTTWSELLVLPDGGILIDTPGLRDVQLWADQDSLSETFADIAGLSGGCRFADCGHGPEPGCAVQEAIAGGTLEHARLQSYLKQREELRKQADTGRWMRNSAGRPARRRKRR